MVNTSASPGFMDPLGEPLPPYPSSAGTYSSHLSPSFISCIASVQPLITWLGANVVGLDVRLESGASFLTSEGSAQEVMSTEDYRLLAQMEAAELLFVDAVERRIQRKAAELARRREDASPP